MESSFQVYDKTFHDLAIAPRILEVLDRSGFKFPSLIQAAAIPLGISGADILGIAQTGTGKTLAFAIPIIQRLSLVEGRAVILSPTRELAQQIHETFLKIGQPLGFHCAVLIGGEDFRQQMNQLNNPQTRIIIATPGRLLDHMRQQSTRLDDAIIMVLDEADRMLDMGFIPSVETIFKYIAKERQTLLFSATMPDAIIHITDKYMTNPHKIEVTPQSSTSTNITQQMYIVSPDHKKKLLELILKENPDGNALVFCRRKIDAASLARHLKNKNHGTVEIHSDKSQEQRFDALNRFKKGQARIMVATDVAARGIDVKGIAMVINYDLPDEASNYIHRIGRTGRAGKTGIAISFANPDQGDLVKDIEKALKMPVPLLTHPDMPQEYLTKPKKLAHKKPARFARRHK